MKKKNIKKQGIKIEIEFLKNPGNIKSQNYWNRTAHLVKRKLIEKKEVKKRFSFYSFLKNIIEDA